MTQNFEKSKHPRPDVSSANGTFGYVPGHPTAYTQPLYGLFLIPIFWIAGFHWWSVGTVQILVAVATSICVFETGRRFLALRIGLLAAVIATLQPYLVWHDIHGNREILDQLIGAALFGLTLLDVEPPVGLDRRRASASSRASACSRTPGSRCCRWSSPRSSLWRGAGWAAAVAVPLLAP